jgi:putative flippase GtrA
MVSPGHVSPAAVEAWAIGVAIKILHRINHLFERLRHAGQMGDETRMSPRGPAAQPRRWVRYLGAGAINTLFGYALYAMLLAIGLTPAIAVTFATIGGALFNFRTIGAVFESRDAGLLPRFAAVYAVNLGLNLTLLHLLIAAGLHPLLAQAGATLLLVPCSYRAMRSWVFAGITA